MKLWEVQLQLDKLFIIPETGEGVDEETGEVFDEEYINALKLTKDEKLKNIGWVYKENDADIEAVTKEIRRLTAIKKTLTNRQDSLKKYVSSVLNGKKWEADDFSCKIGYRMSRDVVTVDDINLVPIEYFKTAQTESNLNKTAVKEAIKEGKEVAGIHLQDNNNIQIK